MAQPIEGTLLESYSVGETAVGELLRRGVYFEQLLTILNEYLYKRKVRILQCEQIWIVVERVNKTFRQRETFSTITAAATYALELYDKHE